MIPGSPPSFIPFLPLWVLHLLLLPNRWHFQILPHLVALYSQELDQAQWDSVYVCVAMWSCYNQDSLVLCDNIKLHNIYASSNTIVGIFETTRHYLSCCVNMMLVFGLECLCNFRTVYTCVAIQNSIWLTLCYLVRFWTISWRRNKSYL